MLRVLGSNKRLCDGITRRDLLQAGGISLLGLGLSDLGRASATPNRAKHVIMLFCYGGMSQLDTLDPKPNAPEDIRGPFGTIPTSLPGVRISEHLPKIGANLHRVALVRTMSHPHPIHGVAYAVTGTDKIDIPMELNRHDSRHWPYFGSVLDYLDDQDHPGRPMPEVPRTLHLPWVQSSRSFPHQRAGLFAGFLGPRYNPVVAEFVGKATNTATYRPDDPYGGLDPSGRFEIANTAMASGLTLDRLSTRLSLLDQFDQQRRHLDESTSGAALSRSRQQALSVTTSPKLRQALDLDKEPDALRRQYGYHLFGQSALQARRLIEGGARLVSVFWDEFGPSCGAWDTHEKQTMRLKSELCPGLDQTFTALLDDLQQRGLLDETLVLCFTEHGRTPQAERRGDSVDGRGHWSECYSLMLAGAGVAPGRVVGTSDARAAYPADRPVSPKDVLHTIYHLLGVDAHRTIPDRLNRPYPLVAEGSVVRELLG
jgi:hypothetical protein